MSSFPISATWRSVNHNNSKESLFEANRCITATSMPQAAH